MNKKTFQEHLRDLGHEATYTLNPNGGVFTIDGENYSARDMDKTKYSYLLKAYLSSDE